MNLYLKMPLFRLESKPTDNESKARMGFNINSAGCAEGMPLAKSGV